MISSKQLEITPPDKPRSRCTPIRVCRILATFITFFIIILASLYLWLRGLNLPFIGYNSTSIAFNSTSTCFNSTSVCFNSTIIGINSTTIGINSTSLGFNSTSIGLNSTSIGFNGTSTGFEQRTSVGFGSNSIGFRFGDSPAVEKEVIISSASPEQHFEKFAVCTDGPPCSTVGKDILSKNGSAVDAAIASLLCNGIYNSHSTGIGGGFQMVIYDKHREEVSVLDAREVAPLASKQNMFVNEPNKSKTGALASGVPGELAGYWSAWVRFGVLPWMDLFEPTLKLCETGYHMSLHQYDALTKTSIIREDPSLAEQFVDPLTKEIKQPGSLVKPNPQLCKTLKHISFKTPSVFYDGPIGESFVADVKSMGGIITMADLNKYSVEWREPVKVTLHGDETVYSTPPPGNGLLLVYILKIMDVYRLSAASLEDKASEIKTWHRLIEAFKSAFAERTKLGDPEFVDLSKLLIDLQSEGYVNATLYQIKDDQTFTNPEYYGAKAVNKDDEGTSHISILAPNGDAVSVTSTINTYFGAKVTSSRTGILLNSEMDDFSTPGVVNNYGLPPSEANFIKPGKRPVSSGSPAIIVNRHGTVRLVIGASGGSLIPTSVAMTTIRHLWMDMNIKKAIDAPRLHHQLFPMKVFYEDGISKDVIKGLEVLGHETEKKGRRSVVCGIAKIGDEILANADYKKLGIAAGL